MSGATAAVPIYIAAIATRRSAAMQSAVRNYNRDVERLGRAL
jgi:hypothetical protein